MKGTVGLVVVASIAAAVWWASGDRDAEVVDDERRADDDARSDDSVPIPRLEGMGYAVSPYGPVWADDEFTQEFAVFDSQTLVVHDRVLDPATGEWTDTYHQGNCTWTIKRRCSAGRDVFGLAGWGRDGALIVQRWDLVDMQVGGAVPAGGQGAPTGQAQKVFMRTELYRGQLGADRIFDLEFDIERRFMILLFDQEGVRWLYEFPNEADTTPVPLVSSSDYPELGLMTWVGLLHHTALGYVWLLRQEDTVDVQMLFIDSDNDGQFDGSPIIGDWDFLEGLGLTDMQDWHDLHSPL